MSDIEQWADETRSEYLFCRDTGIRHPWTPKTARRIAKGFEEELECDRCGTVKIRLLNMSGHPIRTKMIYPDGYLHSGMGRLTKEDNATLRLVAMTRRYKTGKAGLMDLPYSED